MKNLIFSLVIFCSVFASASAFPSDFNNCARFVGKYSKQQDNNDTYSANGLMIGMNSANLQLMFNSDTDPVNWKGWYENYIADGLPHVGGENTGKTYVVKCDTDIITIRREGLLTYPLITEISLSGDQLLYLAFTEGSKPHATFMKLKKVQ